MSRDNIPKVRYMKNLQIWERLMIQKQEKLKLPTS